VRAFPCSVFEVSLLDVGVSHSRPRKVAASLTPATPQRQPLQRANQSAPYYFLPSADLTSALQSKFPRETTRRRRQRIAAPFKPPPHPQTTIAAAAMSRALLHSVLELRTPVTRLPPSFLLPMRPATTTAVQTRLFNQTPQIIESSPVDDLTAALTAAALPTSKPRRDYGKMAPPKQIDHQPPRERLPKAPAPLPPLGPLDASIASLLPLLAAQPSHYVTVHIHGKPYLVTEGDSVRLPFRMPGVEPGDVLRLNRASAVGSRDYTLKGAPYVDERLFECRAIVTGTEAEPMRTIVKKKRRCRRKTHVFSKHKFTILRISEVKICPEVAQVEA